MLKNKSIEVPRWWLLVGVLLLVLCVVEAVMLTHWRDLAHRRASVKIAAEELCSDVLVTAANQAELLSGISEVAQGATDALKQCMADHEAASRAAVSASTAD